MEKKFKFSDIPEVEELQVLFKLVEWVQKEKSMTRQEPVLKQKSDF